MSDEKKQTIEKEVEAKSPLTKEDFKELMEELSAKHAEALEVREKKARMSEKKEDIAIASKVSERSTTIQMLKALSLGDRVTAQKFSEENRKKYLNEGTDADGGFLVDPEFSNEVARIMQDYSVFRRNARIIPMRSNEFNLKTLATNPTVTWVGESVAVSGSTMTFGNPKLVASKLLATLLWTNELQEDQYVGLLNMVQERFAEVIAQAEEVAFTTGTSPFTGILQASGTTDVTMASGERFADLTWDDLIEMDRALSEVSASESRTAQLYISPYAYNILRQLKTSGDGNYFMYSLNAATGNTAPTGQPIEVVQSYPNASDDGAGVAFVTLTDLSKHGYIGDRAGLSVDILDQGIVTDSGGTEVNLNTQDSKAIRVRKRTAFTVVNPRGVVNLVTGA